MINVIVNSHVHEVLLSDYVAGVLGIILLDLKRGLWRLNDDFLNEIRETAEPEGVVINIIAIYLLYLLSSYGMSG